MIALILALTLTAELQASASLSGVIEVDDREPVVLESTVEVPEGWGALLDWQVREPAKAREFEDGSKLAVWAPPGRHEVTLSVVMAKATGGQITFKKLKQVYVLKVRGPPQPAPKPDDPQRPVSKVDRVTYVYERRETVPPAEILQSFRGLNQRGIIASAIDQDAVTGAGKIPEQYRVALEAAKGKLPCLVVQSGEAVVRVVEGPTTAEQVEAAIQ